MNKSRLLSEVSTAIRVTPAHLERMLVNAPYRYRHYTVKKRSGGFRDIYQPTASLKEVQRWVTANCFASLPVSRAVYSYREGIGIRSQAEMHRESNYFVRLDFENFFPSIDSLVLRNYLIDMRAKGFHALDTDALDFVVPCLCRRVPGVAGPRGLVLTIGAPSSPHLSNAVLFDFDEYLLRAASRIGGVYTRYADDVFLSARTIDGVVDLERVARGALKNFLPYLKINERKVRRYSRKSRVRICGVTIASDRTLSIGRDTKKLVRSKVDWAMKGRLDKGQMENLRGWLSYLESIEPGYLIKLEDRLGPDRYSRLMRVG